MREQHVVARNLSKSFGTKQVLDNLSFSVEPGDVIGVLGKNGAGKTTLLELMLGFTPVSQGQVEVFGHESFHLSGESKSRIGFVPQQDEMIDQLNANQGDVRRRAAEALHPAGTRSPPRAPDSR
jgi:ABC-2 type transport system ATP-binding protein